MPEAAIAYSPGVRPRAAQAVAGGAGRLIRAAWKGKLFVGFANAR